MNQKYGLKWREDVHVNFGFKGERGKIEGRGVATVLSGNLLIHRFSKGGSVPPP
jgi:hypothetical protein